MASDEVPPYRLDIEMDGTVSARSFTSDQPQGETDLVPYHVFEELVQIICRLTYKTSDTNEYTQINSVKILERLGVSEQALQLANDSTWARSVDISDVLWPSQSSLSSTRAKQVEDAHDSSLGTQQRDSRPLSPRKRSLRNWTMGLKAAGILIFVASNIGTIVWFATQERVCGLTPGHVLASIVLAVTWAIGLLGGIAALLPWDGMSKENGQAICALLSFPSLICGIVMALALSQFACGDVFDFYPSHTSLHG